MLCRRVRSLKKEEKLKSLNSKGELRKNPLVDEKERRRIFYTWLVNHEWSFGPATAITFAALSTLLYNHSPHLAKICEACAIGGVVYSAYYFIHWWILDVPTIPSKFWLRKKLGIKI